MVQFNLLYKPIILAAVIGLKKGVLNLKGVYFLFNFEDEGLQLLTQTYEKIFCRVQT